MANWDDVNSCLEDVLRRGGELTPDQAFNTSSVFVGQALRYLNRARWKIASATFWPWRRRDPPGVVRLRPALTAGTALVTQDGSTATLSVAPSAALGSLTGWKFMVGNLLYRVGSSHVAGSASIPLDSPYDGDTNPTASYTLVKDEYALPSDCDRPLALLHPDQVDPLTFLDERSFRSQFPQPLLGQVPDAWTIIGQQKIQVSHVPSNARSVRLEVPYELVLAPVVIGDPGSALLIPSHQRPVLADFALYFLFQDKDDSKADEAAALAETGLDEMKVDLGRRLPTNGRVRYRDLS